MKNSNLTTEFDYNKFCEDFIVLLTKSEDRIDRINNMVLTLAETTNRIIYFHETTYNDCMQQFNKLQAAHAELLQQNKLLLCLIDKFGIIGAAANNININDNK